MKDVLQALEELAVNYDQKSQEVETKNREYNTISDELTQKQTQLNNISSELSALKDSSMHTKKRVNEMLRSLLTDLGEVGTVITKKDDLKKPDTNAEGGKIEEEFTVARLYVSKMKSEVKNLVHKATQLEPQQTEGTSKRETLEKELSESRLLIGQHEAKMKSLSENIKEVESKKRALEEQMDSLNEEVSKMKATEQMHQVKFGFTFFMVYAFANVR